MYLHILSPILYYLFVKSFNFVKPMPKNNYMLYFRTKHNEFLSILSFIMLVGIIIFNFNNNKLFNLNAMICNEYIVDPYNIGYYSVYLFLYSKYIEWFDTLFLYLSNKKISSLQFNHHLSTVLLSYFNINNKITPAIFIFMASNCFVHIPMYWYFAYPKGILYHYRKYITIIQIIQHIVCFGTCISTFFILENCEQPYIGNILAIILYSIYFSQFLHFYLTNY